MPFEIERKRVSGIANGRWLYSGLLFGLLASMAGVTPLQASSVFWGAEASGNARQFEITCGTCPNPITDFGTQKDGGFGQPLGAVEFGTADVSYDAISIFNGPNALPHLRAQSSAGIKVEPATPSTFFFAAGSTARSTQQFTYKGTKPSKYTLEYTVNGQVSGGILAEIAGGFTVFGHGFNPNQEVNPTLGFVFDHVNGDGSERQVHFTGEVTFTVNPGDDFFVQATLDTFVDSRSQQLAADADASHTFDMSFTQGDASLLIPAAPATSDVPEPVTTTLFGIGLAGVGLAMRRRGRPGV
ncbi:MAG TPA: PEP-CTERM sorting domain-containing protein [Bryobacteraceae bacterium]|jgi:hypothetical protein